MSKTELFIMVLLSKKFLYALLIFPCLVHAQVQSVLPGFINIDCGLSEIASYTDETTGFHYVSDANFTEFGENMGISPAYKEKTSERQFLKVRAFPRGMKNCYTLRAPREQGTRYLIRARFMYGNYDNKDQNPLFDLYLGVDFWDTVKIKDSEIVVDKEILHTPLSNYIHVCLVNKDYGDPFISVLELRPISSEIYTSKTGLSLNLVYHYDFSSSTNQTQRYKDDVYDRLWTPLYTDVWTPFINSSSSERNSISKGEFEIPSSVMSNAYTSTSNLNYLNLYEPDLNSSSLYFIYMHFAELEILQLNQTREFNIYANDYFWEPLSPSYLKTETVYNTRGITPNEKGQIWIWLNNTKKATLSPLINAFEIYELKEFSGQDTIETDVEAILNIISVYELKRLEWQGDPCGPRSYLWGGLNCSYTVNSPSRITSLNLSLGELEGEIAPAFARLTALKYLDLSNNNLTGKVPEFLAHLNFLELLIVTGNNFTRPIPKALLSKEGLTLRVDEYLNDTKSCSSSCGEGKSFVVPLLSSLGSLIFVLGTVLSILWILRNKRLENATKTRDIQIASVDPKDEDDQFGSKKQSYSYSEIERMTEKFKKVIGEGGFGKVYHGYLNGKEVAVKMLSSSSIQGHRQFQAELKLLMRVHHKNLTTLVGYCNEENHVGLIYEYMAMGNLRSHISGSKSQSILSWKDRLRIAIDTAQGLEYLHNGCKPAIIHRDVKSTNILLDDKFQAKLGDFGLSKIFPLEGGNQTSTFGHPGITSSVAGTPGYLDPEYYITNWLNEKSDVYSFGVVLLEIITARPVLTKARDRHIIQWVSSMLSTGNIVNIVDPKLRGDHDINTVWKAIEISMACVSKSSNNRPTMSRVTSELKDCLMSELIRRDGREMSDFSKDSSIEINSRIMLSEYSPIAR